MDDGIEKHSASMDDGIEKHSASMDDDLKEHLDTAATRGLTGPILGPEG